MVAAHCLCVFWEEEDSTTGIWKVLMCVCMKNIRIWGLKHMILLNLSMRLVWPGIFGEKTFSQSSTFAKILAFPRAFVHPYILGDLLLLVLYNGPGNIKLFLTKVLFLVDSSKTSSNFRYCFTQTREKRPKSEAMQSRVWYMTLSLDLAKSECEWHSIWQRSFLPSFPMIRAEENAVAQ